MFSKSVFSQKQDVMALSQYNMLHSAYFNPSLASLSKRKWQIHLVGIHTNFNQNMAFLKIPFSLYKIPNNVPIEYQTTQGNFDFNENWIVLNTSNRLRNVYFSSEVNLPSFIFKTRKNFTFGLINSVHVNFRLVGLHKEVANVLKNIDNDNNLTSIFSKIGSPFSLPKISSSATVYAKSGLHFSKAFELDYKRKISFGINFSRVFGFQGVQFFQQPITATYLSDTSIGLSRSTNKIVVLDNNKGKGFSSDLGFTYIHHKKHNQRNYYYDQYHTDYLFKIGLAILEIGKIKYSDITIHENQIREGELISETEYNNIDRRDIKTVSNSVADLFGTTNSYKSNYNVGLPTRLALNTDFQFRKNLFIGAQLVQSLRGKHSQNIREQSYLMISPRFNKKWIEVSLPFGLFYDYSSFRQGFQMRLGPLYLGTSNMLNFIPRHKISDFDIFAGLLISDFNFKFLKKGTKSKKGKSRKCYEF